jgi:hypothetical protein
VVFVTAPARPVGLVPARAEAPVEALEPDPEVAAGLGLPCTQKTSQASTG